MIALATSTADITVTLITRSSITRTQVETFEWENSKSEQENKKLSKVKLLSVIIGCPLNTLTSKSKLPKIFPRSCFH